MSKTIRVYLTVAVLAVIGLFVGIKVLEMPAVGIGIAALAAVGGLVLLRRESVDESDFLATPDESEVETHASTSTETAEPLATWEPSEGLATWTPPSESEYTPTLVEEEAEPEEEPLDLLDLEELEHIDEFVEAEAAEQAEAEAEAEFALDEEAITESVVEEEVELEEAHPANIDEIEDVHSDDDIMKASHATELSVTAPQAADNSELAKLLAKVQSRLAAYE